MGWFGHTKKQGYELSDPRWKDINLTYLKPKGFTPRFLYCYLWSSLVLSVMIYTIDSFIAINLLFFGQLFSEIKLSIPFDVAKWVFSGSVILSLINLTFRALRAIRVIKHGSIAKCYMDSLALRWESIRFGSGQGWRRFLVFAKLTERKKVMEYIALLTYFRLQCKPTACTYNFFSR